MHSCHTTVYIIYFIFRTNGKSLLYLVLICYLVFKCHKELLLLEMKDMTSLLTESLATAHTFSFRTISPQQKNQVQ
jgi:hypothetical protein